MTSLDREAPQTINTNTDPDPEPDPEPTPEQLSFLTSLCDDLQRLYHANKLPSLLNRLQPLLWTFAPPLLTPTTITSTPIIPTIDLLLSNPDSHPASLPLALIHLDLSRLLCRWTAAIYSPSHLTLYPPSLKPPIAPGALPNIPPGSCFPSQLIALRAGIHGTFQGGIHGTSLYGAYSIILSKCRTYASIDRDLGATIFYSGTPTKGPNPTEPTKNTQLLLKSLETKNPVRVIRAAKAGGEWSPAVGVRYDGLYVVSSAEQVEGWNYCFRLERCPDQVEMEVLKMRPGKEEQAVLRRCIEELAGEKAERREERWRLEAMMAAAPANSNTNTIGNPPTVPSQREGQAVNPQEPVFRNAAANTRTNTNPPTIPSQPDQQDTNPVMSEEDQARLRAAVEEALRDWASEEEGDTKIKREEDDTKVKIKDEKIENAASVFNAEWERTEDQRIARSRQQQQNHISQRQNPQGQSRLDQLQSRVQDTDVFGRRKRGWETQVDETSETQQQRYRPPPGLQQGYRAPPNTQQRPVPSQPVPSQQQQQYRPPSNTQQQYRPPNTKQRPIPSQQQQYRPPSTQQRPVPSQPAPSQQQQQYRPPSNTQQQYRTQSNTQQYRPPSNTQQQYRPQNTQQRPVSSQQQQYRPPNTQQRPVSSQQQQYQAPSNTEQYRVPSNTQQQSRPSSNPQQQYRPPSNPQQQYRPPVPNTQQQPYRAQVANTQQQRPTHQSHWAAASNPQYRTVPYPRQRPASAQQRYI